MTTDIVPPLKRCTKCGEEKPATVEYFNKHNGSASGLRPDCKDCHRRMQRQYANDNRELHNSRNRLWLARNPDKLKRSQKQYRANNAEYERTRQKEWIRLNPEKRRAALQRRRAHKNNLPATFTAEQWQTCLEYFHHTCAYCGAQQSFWHVLEQDHVTPVSKGGGYTAANIVPACKSCNVSKGNRNLQVWLKSRFGKRAKTILERILAYFDTVTR